MNRFVLTVILVVTSTLVESNVATAASNPSLPQSDAKATSVSGPDSNFSEFRNADNSSHAEPKPDTFNVAQWVSNVCRTPVGACGLPAYAPAGTSCWCNFGGVVYWGSVQ